MNELLLFCILIISILTLYLSNKYLNDLGLKMVFITFNLLSLILSFKYLPISTLNASASVITYSVMYTTICLLLEKGHTKETDKLIKLNFIINIFSSIMLYITSYYTQSINDTIGINMTNTFINNYRILIFYPISIFISQKLLIIIYSKIKKIYENLFISMVTSYLAIGLIDSVIFTFLTYYNKLNIQTIIKLLLSTYMIRIIIIVIYSIIITIFSHIKRVKK